MRRALLYMLGLAAACALAGTLSYVLVLFLLGSPESAGPQDAIRLRDAEQLRLYSNELLSLTSEFLSLAPSESSAHSQRTSSVQAATLHPRLNDLRQRMLSSDLRGAAFTSLLAAADRAAAMAMRPEDTALQKSAANQVLDAVALAEKHIESMGLRTKLGTPALAPGYRRRRGPS